MSKIIDGAAWLTVDEVAERSQLHRNTVLALIWNGEMPAKRLSRGAWHVRDADFVAWLTTPDNVKVRRNHSLTKI